MISKHFRVQTNRQLLPRKVKLHLKSLIDYDLVHSHLVDPSAGCSRFPQQPRQQLLHLELRLLMAEMLLVLARLVRFDVDVDVDDGVDVDVDVDVDVVDYR